MGKKKIRMAICDYCHKPYNQLKVPCGKRVIDNKITCELCNDLIRGIHD